MHSVIVTGMIIDLPIGKVERDLQSLIDPVFELMPKIEFASIHLAITAAAELPRDPVFQLELPLIRRRDFVREREMTFAGVNRTSRRKDERERHRSQLRPQP